MAEMWRIASLASDIHFWKGISTVFPKGKIKTIRRLQFTRSISREVAVWICCRKNKESCSTLANLLLFIVAYATICFFDLGKNAENPVKMKSDIPFIERHNTLAGELAVSSTQRNTWPSVVISDIRIPCNEPGKIPNKVKERGYPGRGRYIWRHSWPHLKCTAVPDGLYNLNWVVGTVRQVNLSFRISNVLHSLWVIDECLDIYWVRQGFSLES